MTPLNPNCYSIDCAGNTTIAVLLALADFISDEHYSSLQYLVVCGSLTGSRDLLCSAVY